MNTLHHGGSENPDIRWPPKGSPTARDLREWADNPITGSEYVPIHQKTLRYLACELEMLEIQRGSHNSSVRQEKP